MEKGSFNIRLVQTSAKKGVMYARLDILAVSPDCSAMTQRVFASAMVNIPFHRKPKVWVKSGINKWLLQRLMMVVRRKVAKYPSIIERNFS